MLKAGLAGIGSMGRGHLDNYLRFAQEGFPVQLPAIAEIDDKKWRGEFIPGNIDNVGVGKYNFAQFRQYRTLTDMLKGEKLDYVDIALPTYLHAENAIEAMEAGCHVLCEKPMALSVRQCDEMIAASKKTGKTLMIAQCLRFWPAYVEVKKIVDSGRFGKPVCAYFFRGGGTPRWSYENWLLQKDKAGGALLDQHIHDVDTIQWLFGMPKAVSTLGRNVFAGSGYDAVTTNYVFEEKLAVNAQDDWTINGEFGFSMVFRCNFEGGSCILDKNGFTVYPSDGPKETPELVKDSAYYLEMKYFADCIASGAPVARCTPESTRDTIRIAEAEIRSADQNGALTAV